jgi:hypothetical protein
LLRFAQQTSKNRLISDFLMFTLTFTTSPTQGIAAKIPQAPLAGAEELQRKARFFAKQKMRPSH